MLTKYERCVPSGVFSDCDAEKAIVMYEGEALDIMEEYGIQAYKTFSACFDDLREGKRNTAQVSEEKAKEYQEKYNKEEFQQAMKFITFFEKKWTCSGICSSSMFYYTLPMSDGPPT